MNYREAYEIDLKLGLLSGGDIKVDNLIIKPYILEEIKNYGYTKYMKNLQWISISVDDFMQSISDDNKKSILVEQKEKLKTFDFYLKLGGKEILDNLVESFAMIFRTDDIRVLDEGIIAIGFLNKGILHFDKNGNLLVNKEVLNSLDEDELTIIHRDNFDDIVEVVKLQNFLIKPSVKNNQSEANPVDEETRKLLEDMERNRKRVEEKKNKQKKSEKENEDIDISDIVSAVSSKSNSVNKLNIWQLTLYQIYDEYSRLELIDNYDFSIKAMMAGAEKIDLRHWSSKL